MTIQWPLPVFKSILQVKGLEGTAPFGSPRDSQSDGGQQSRRRTDLCMKKFAAV